MIQSGSDSRVISACRVCGQALRPGEAMVCFVCLVEKAAHDCNVSYHRMISNQDTQAAGLAEAMYQRACTHLEKLIGR